MTVFKWAYRHHHLDVNDYDNLNDALEAADYANDDFQEALYGIEVVGPDGRTFLTADEAWKLIAPIRAERWKRIELSKLHEPGPEIFIEVMGPDGNWAREWWSNDSHEHAARVAWYRERLGDDRVREVQA